MCGHTWGHARMCTCVYVGTRVFSKRKAAGGISDLGPFHKGLAILTALAPL